LSHLVVSYILTNYNVTSGWWNLCSASRRSMVVQWTEPPYCDNWANRSTFPHRRSTPLTFWSYLPIIQYTPASQALYLSIDAFTGTPPATDWKHRRVVHWKLGFNRWKKIWVYPSVPVNSQPWTTRCGDCYNPQPVKCCS